MSGEAVLKKLYFIKAANALIVNAPAEYLDMIGEVTYDKEPEKTKKGQYDFVQVFAIEQDELVALLKKVAPYAKPDCFFWACYPKGGKLKSNIKRESVWAAFETIQLDVVSSVSINDTWTALRARPFKS
ncbi:hypothetical protein DVR12_00695 [Chitinophaga silvatica]|uniref:DUF3052 domain-containing protein n=1 Tax=Chitinophaga silvatica TaxID=2282649 RepID=A0A3E1YG33_9BACT|nr:hypothetical protein [Chitinophaga silvatica]RFS26339.1 hypothetical protein DVR12_00695 [Chitinophaga silvatica]